jgi:ABC-type Fe3+-hydroxamate transport system substrate-binding protein
MMQFPSTFRDQMGHEVRLALPPRRIISLVPSQTEFLYDLGLEEEVVGITKFCVHPEKWFRSKTRVGGTKQYDFEKIAALQPDLIIGNKEENEREQILELQKIYPVWMSDITDLSSAREMMLGIGALTGKQERAAEIIATIDERFRKLKVRIAEQSEKRVVYLIWKSPFMAAGPGTFIDHLLLQLRLQNVLTTARYPETTLTELAALNPELVLLSSEPYPFGEKHIGEIQAALPSSRVLLVDGEMFSWYGSRLLNAPDYFLELLARIS